MRPSLFVLCLLGLLTACGPGEAPTYRSETVTDTATRARQPAEKAVQLLPITGPLGRRVAEVSGMAWYGEWLVFLPQHPQRFSECGGDGCLFAYSREQILDAIARGGGEPLRPRSITFTAQDIGRQIEGFEGYEAIVFRGDEVFLTIEARGRDGGMQGYLVRGRVEQGGASVHLDPSTIVRLPEQVGLQNMSYETVLTYGDGVVTVHEVNGVNVNPVPTAYVYDRDLRPRDTLSFPTIEYRVTDATEPDTSGLFWVANYLYPGEITLLSPAHDTIVDRFGQGATHRRFSTVERLVPLRMTAEGVRYADQEPLQLELIGDESPRNWEGIAYLPGRGFLLVTDSYPETLLAFIPHRPGPVRTSHGTSGEAR